MHTPVDGPLPYTEEWYATLKQRIGASEAAAACGLSEERQPLDVYLEKTGLREPFEGNDYTRRGHRFEPFLAQEYTARTGVELEGDLPTYFHPEYPFIAASPDRRWKSDPLHLVELKCCNWRRAQKLGPEGSDDVFDDWAMQAHQQMAVTGAHTCDVFVMVDLHTYRHYIVERNERVIAGLIDAEKSLWNKILAGIPPTVDFNNLGALDLMKELYGSAGSGSKEMSRSGVEAWVEYTRIGQQMRALEKERDRLKAKLLDAIGDAACAVFPSGKQGLFKVVTQIAGHVRQPSKSIRLMQKEIKHG
jgi:putative phage-type endonuclease